MARYPEFQNQTVVVTGAASPGGIGEAIATQFAQEGAIVFIVDIDLAGAESLAGQLRQNGGRADALQADVTDGESLNAMAAQMFQREGKLDVLINNAGGFPVMKYINEIDEADWDAVLDLNLKSVFLCCRAFTDSMASRRAGSIVNISSMAGRTPTLPDPVHYSAAKGGILAFTRALAQELGPYGVRVNTVAPGWTSTTRFLRIRGEDAETKLKPRLPLGRLGRPTDVARAVLFLSSAEAGYITGATLDVNGGIVML